MGVRGVGDLIQSSTCGYSVFPAPVVEENVFLQMHVFDSFVKTQMAKVWKMSPKGKSGLEKEKQVQPVEVTVLT
jgi:hypothetical protein